MLKNGVEAEAFRGVRILLVEDDDMIAAGLELALTRAHYHVSRVSSGLSAQSALAAAHYDLVILDLGLPGMDGYQVLESMRKAGSLVSVLILSARDALKDRVRGLDLGADDYLTKPFELDELLARVRVLERRRAQQASNRLTIGQLQLDIDSPEVSWNGRSIDLPRREWMLLKLLMQNPSRVYSREHIQDALYGWGEGCESNAIDVHVHHLRRKITPDVVLTVRGLGYRLGVNP